MDEMTLTSERLTLTPLGPDDAEEMAGVLADERLYEFTGGRPEAAEVLRARYGTLAAGSVREDETWLNWVVRLTSDDSAVGTIQATVIEHEGDHTAWVAWVIGVPWQGRGFATVAARLLVTWLVNQGVTEVLAAVHPNHAASTTVASRIGLEPTDQVVDGERVWRSVPSP